MYKKSLEVAGSESLSAWYNEIIYKTDLVDESAVRGCCILRPYGYAIWEEIQAGLNARIKASGVKNAYFPLFIPESFLKKEKDHVEGFSPELAVVTHAGGSKLEEPLVVRPTSETVIYAAFSRWIKSWRDLPLKINQWANVVRWEMRTRPFLRTTEFLWQEGHTAHATEEEALEAALFYQELYRKFYEDYLAVATVTGPKTDSEKFAGAKSTFTLEALMPDGRALQIGTSHLLSHNFPEVFGVKFQSASGQEEVPWCTSWGTTTRMIGAAIMIHGDSKGLVLPPRIAPIQVAIIPIKKSGQDNSLLDKFCDKIFNQLTEAGIRVNIDSSDQTPGFRFNKTEQLGIPVRIEVGARDVASDSVICVARSIGEQGDSKPQKESVSVDALVSWIGQTLDSIHFKMLAHSKEFTLKNTTDFSKDKSVPLDVLQTKGFVRLAWCKQQSCEVMLKEWRATARVVVAQDSSNICFGCKMPAKCEILAARSY